MGTQLTTTVPVLMAIVLVKPGLQILPSSSFSNPAIKKTFEDK